MTTATMWSNQDLDVMKRDLKQLCTLEETQEHLNHKFTLVEIAKKKLEILHGNIPVNKSDNSTGNVQHIEGPTVH